MTPLSPTLQAHFDDAAQATPTSPEVDCVMRRIAPGHHRLVSRRVSRTATIALVALALAGSGTVGAVATGWSPIGTDNPSAAALVTTRDPVPAAVLDQIEALKAPPLPGDRDTDARDAAAVVPNSGPVYAGATRLVGTTPLGERMYLVAVQDDLDTGRDPHATGSDAYTALALVVQGKFGGIGTVGPIPMSSVQSPRGLLSVESPAIGAGADALRADGDVPAALKSGNWFAEIVPDGVATVRITHSDGAITDLAVTKNVAFGHSSRALGGTSVTWLAADGSTIAAAP